MGSRAALRPAEDAAEDVPDAVVPAVAAVIPTILAVALVVALQEALAEGSVAKNIFGRGRSSTSLSQAAIWKSEATSLAWPIASLPANLLTCPFLIMFTASMPSRVRSAVWNRLKHCDARTFFLTKRWSCSITLFSYFIRR